MPGASLSAFCMSCGIPVMDKGHLENQSPCMALLGLIECEAERGTPVACLMVAWPPSQPGDVAAEAQSKPAAAGSKRKAKATAGGTAPAKKPAKAAKAPSKGGKKPGKPGGSVGRKAPATKRPKAG